VLGFLGIRWIAWRMLLLRCRRGEVNRVAILGSGRLAAELARKFEDHPEFMCKVVGFLCPTAEFAPQPRDAATPSRTVSTIEVTDLLSEAQVDEVVLVHTPATQEILQLITLCRQRFITVSLIPQPYELYLSEPRLVDLGGLPVLQLGDAFPPVPAGMAKRGLDVGMSLVLAALTLPVMLVSGLVLRLSTGRAFRWEKRVGQNGAQFSMLRLNVDRAGSNQSPASSFLARFSISELPQFWNVLRGEMSLVGPRPEAPERANRYSEWQRRRLTTRPGMTGLAQVHGLREQHSSEEKTRLDLQYMLRPSLLKDLSLLIETAWTLALRLIKIPKDVLSGDSPKTVEGLLTPVAHSPDIRPFAEILQHAHRTQSGSN
jgi:lipopolysaccharide/colanic/teichoic acid biosynthesis glycosyltransferase